MKTTLFFLCISFAVFTIHMTADNKKTPSLVRSTLSAQSTRLAQKAGINSMFLDSDYKSPGQFFARCHKEMVKETEEFSAQPEKIEKASKEALSISTNKKYIIATVLAAALYWRLGKFFGPKFALLIKKFSQKRTTKTEIIKK